MFRFTLYFIIFFLSKSALRTANANYEIDYSAIRQFIHWVEIDNRNALSKHVEYPLSRSYPIPDVNSEEEFIHLTDLEIYNKLLKNN